MISVLLPVDQPDYEAQLGRITASGTLSPFDPLVIDFLDAVSKAILLDEITRRLAEMAAVAHWMRKAHTLELRSSFEQIRSGRIWLARGLALHFAPANVDSIFLYSWFISLLMGNANIVRISQHRKPQVDVILEKINLVLEQERFLPIRDRSLVLSYEHDDALTRRLSEACHLRVLWGGDESVRRLRAIPMNPLGCELVFPDRFSLAALKAEEVIRLQPDRRTKLCAHFCNDAYWFDQMACSSPRLLVWVGSRAVCCSAQEVFWPQVRAELCARGFEYPEVVGVNKLVSSFKSAATGLADLVHRDTTGPVARIHLATLETPEFRDLVCGGGFFMESEIPDLGCLAELLTEKDQTLSYFGFPEAELRALARALPARAIDRLVPIGSALDFSVIWDGNNLLRSFGREVDLRGSYLP